MYRRILVPIDPAHGEVARRIVAVAKLLAGGHGEITLLTVLEPVPSYVANYIPKETVEANREHALDQLVDLARAAGLPEDSIALTDGRPSTKILETAEKLRADAIVLGAHRPDYTDYLIGSTASRVVRHAPCTVVVERSEAGS